MPNCCQLAWDELCVEYATQTCSIPDCNVNDQADESDITSGWSDDCNGNAIPDECEMAVPGTCIYCDGDCETDCNRNGLLDSCDIASGAPDSNGNGIPDECEYIAPDPPLGTGEAARTNRYLRFSAPGGAEEVIRVRFVSLDGFPTPDPDFLYLGPPFDAPEEDSSQSGLTFPAAPLQCDVYAHDWSSLGIISAYGAEIMPGSTYELSRADATCPNLATDGACWSTPLVIETAKYGDVAPLYDNPASPQQPDFNDIAGLVGKFLATPGAPIKAVVQLQPNVVFPSRSIDFRDIAADVSAFLGALYSESEFGPCTCPPAVTCGTTPCTTDLQCLGAGDGLCVDNFCRDKCGRCGQ